VKLAPQLEAHVGPLEDVRVVYADIGVTGRGRVNWAAPVLRARGIRAIPHLLVLDLLGHLEAEGAGALQIVQRWRVDR
jgi:hypothetical protein